MRFAKNVTFMFDADRAGTEAMLRSGELARGHSLRPMVAVLPGGKDPADVAVEGGREAVAKVTKGKISLLGFELRQALTRGDTTTADGRVRVFEEVRRIMRGASSLKEREEEIPLLADRLRLTEKDVEQLLRGEPGPTGRGERGAAGKGQVSMTQRLLGSEAGVEREFLVAAVCNPERAVDVLEALTPEHFADPNNREVFLGLREALALMTGPEDQQAALAELQVRARGGSEVGPLFVRLVMEADQGRYAPAVLEELHLRLQEQHLIREINVLRASLDGGTDMAETQRRLVRLERLRESVRASLTNLDPDEDRV
jgi:DNA primase